MASKINPNFIDGSYPVAGQDNNSQGFRDNFTNIKVNFQYAEDEINDLETNVLVKAALAGTTVNNNMNNNTIYAINLNDVSTTRIALPNTSGLISVNYASGQYQTVAPSAGSCNITVTNWPAAGFYGGIRIAITLGAGDLANTVTFNAGALLLGTTGLQGYESISAAAGFITFAAAGVYVFDLSTSDGGATVTITDQSRPLNGNIIGNITGITFGTIQSLSGPGAVNVTMAVTELTTTDVAEALTLANGTAGQFKYIVHTVDGGSAVLTPTTAIGFSTITFTDVGDSVTLVYTATGWACVGVKGATFT